MPSYLIVAYPRCKVHLLHPAQRQTCFTIGSTVVVMLPSLLLLQYAFADRADRFGILTKAERASGGAQSAGPPAATDLRAGV
jgi:hypothetical protein